MPWDKKRNEWRIGPNELIPNEKTHPCFARATTDVRKALRYMEVWNTRTYVECLRNAILVIQEHGSDEEWQLAEAQLNKIREHIPYQIAVLAVDGGIPVAMDIEKHYILRKYETEMTRHDRFLLKHESDLGHD